MCCSTVVSLLYNSVFSLCVREVYLTSLQCSRRSMVGGDGSHSGSGLPSLVDTRKSTAQEVCFVLVHSGSLILKL